MKTYLLGDIHGEFDRCVDILRHVGLIDENDNWRKGVRDTLIQVGDVIDRGESIIESYKLIRDIQEQAEVEGGSVIRLLGNHELGYIGGPKITSREEGYKLAHVIKMDIAARKLIAAHLLDDWVVVHAGITPEIASGHEPEGLVNDFNDKLIWASANDDFSDDIFCHGTSRGGLHEPGIFWADYDVDLIPVEEKLIKQIVGHSPPHAIKPEIRVSPNGRVINIDLGMCKMYGGHKGILLYEDNEFKPIII